MFRRLNALEARLRVRLFDRSPRGYALALTGVGERMLPSAERVEDEILALERRLLGGDVRLSEALRVTTTGCARSWSRAVYGVSGRDSRGSAS